MKFKILFLFLFSLLTIAVNAQFYTIEVVKDTLIDKRNPCTSCLRQDEKFTGLLVKVEGLTRKIYAPYQIKVFQDKLYSIKDAFGNAANIEFDRLGGTWTKTTLLNYLQAGAYGASSGSIGIELDPMVGSHIKAITPANISDWNNSKDSIGIVNDSIIVAYRSGNEIHRDTIRIKSSGQIRDTATQFYLSNNNIFFKDGSLLRFIGLVKDSTSLVSDSILVKYEKIGNGVYSEINRDTIRVKSPIQIRDTITDLEIVDSKLRIKDGLAFKELELPFVKDSVGIVSDSIVVSYRALGSGSYAELSRDTISVAPVVNTVAEYGEQVLSGSVPIPTTSTTSANSTDILSFTLPSAGVWEVDYIVRGGTPTILSTASAGMVVSVHDSSNAIVANSELKLLREFHTIATTYSSDIQASGTGKVSITTTGAATYKIRGYHDATTGSNPWLALSDANGRTKVSWNKIAGFLPSTTTPPTQTGTPLVVGSTRSYVLQWDGTQIVNALARETGSNVNGSYEIDHISGLIKQWGTTAASVTHGGTANLSIPFANNNYQLVLNVNNWNSFGWVGAKTTTNFNVNIITSAGGANSGTVTWIAIGNRP